MRKGLSFGLIEVLTSVGGKFEDPYGKMVPLISRLEICEVHLQYAGLCKLVKARGCFNPRALVV